MTEQQTLSTHLAKMAYWQTTATTQGPCKMHSPRHCAWQQTNRLWTSYNFVTTVCSIFNVRPTFLTWHISLTWKPLTLISSQRASPLQGCNIMNIFSSNFGGVSDIALSGHIYKRRSICTDTTTYQRSKPSSIKYTCGGYIKRQHNLVKLL